MISAANKSISRQATPSCRLAALQRWNAQTHLSGLKLVGDSLEIDSEFFSCCSGSGIEVVETLSQHAGYRSARMCGLVGRWSRFAALTRTLRGYFPSQNCLDLVGFADGGKTTSAMVKLRQAVERWRNLHSTALRSGKRGRLITDAVEIFPGVTETWAGLATCIWHENIRVLVHLHATGDPPLGAWTKELQEATGQQTIILVERVRNLFDANKLQELEQIIGFAARTSTPLWLVTAANDTNYKDHEKSQDPVTQQPASSSSFTKGLGKRMQKYRRGPIEQWLSAQSLGRLREVCDLPSPQR